MTIKLIKGICLTACLLISFCSFTQAQQPQVISRSSNSGSLNGGFDSWGRPAPDSRGWTDPALNHNKLVQQQAGDGMYKLIGPYKVVGTQFLYGEHHMGDMFSTEAKAFNIFISYNTFNQEVEFYSTSNPDRPLIKEPGEVDSFMIHQNIELEINTPLKFVYGTHLGSGDKYFYQEVYAGKQFSLYKRYKSELGYVSTNYVQSELRQFDLTFEYYYNETGKKGVKKIKPNASSVVKEFKNIKDLSVAVNSAEFDVNREESLRKAFDYLNK